MYHHTVSGLSTVKSTFDYGWGSQEHVKDYWKATKIKCYWADDVCFAYHVDLKNYCGTGMSEEQAIEDLLMALDDRIR